jgi:L-asparaginase
MRPASAISADGYLNLLNAVRVAADPQSRGRGCVVVMNDTIHGARDVTKNATFRVDAFEARDLRPLGFADGRQGRLWHPAAWAAVLAQRGEASWRGATCRRGKPASSCRSP